MWCCCILYIHVVFVIMCMHISMSWINIYKVNIIGGLWSWKENCCLVHLWHCYDVINWVQCIIWCHVCSMYYVQCILLVHWLDGLGITYYIILCMSCVIVVGIKMNDTSYSLETTWRFFEHDHTQHHGPDRTYIIHNSTECLGIFEGMP